ncbi:hypothetical protein [Larkinella rosea]|uniref:T9SS C-terminal target domain-containing protein n=1 Tax=Larkinella rosea TaxID=2025312 RepID=A0A3P1C2T6_9BACT|nr:hypothetical protein [Larkinella rosea]RRB07559.1 hypothetical protein EHT25_07210 [Larkinella rosea]
MKTLLKKTVCGYQHLLMICFILAGFAATAQSDYYARTDSSKAYWKIQTDFSSQQTKIRFFNNQNEPIYQETLSGRYVKLTDRNIRLFDSMLQRLLNNQLLLPEVKSHELMATTTGVPYYTVSTPVSKPVSTSYVLASLNEPLEANPLRSDIAINNNGRLKIQVVNLFQEPLLVTVVDDQGRHVFKEKAAMMYYTRTLNLTQLAEGKFRVEVAGARKIYNYRLTIQSNPNSYKLVAIP